MKRCKAGDNSKGICEGCRAVVTTKFAYRDVPFNDGIGIARNVLAGVCTQCDSVVSLPAQSEPEVAHARREAIKRLEAAEGLPNVTKHAKMLAEMNRSAAEGDIPIQPR